MSAKDGGPAFPAEGPSAGQFESPGMTLRDYFAAKAMHAELVTCGVPGESCNALIQAIKETGETPEAHMARVAYEMADAMIAERERVTP